MAEPLPPADECHYEVSVTYERQDEKELFVTLDKAKAYAADMLQQDDVVKCTIKKKEPKEDDDASDGGRVPENQTKIPDGEADGE